MDVRVTHHIDKSEQRPDGLYDYYYEYDRYEFVFGPRMIWARRYVEEPSDSIALMGGFDDATNSHFSFYAAPEARSVIACLQERGFENIRVLGGPQGTYALLDQDKLEHKQ